MDDVVLTEAPVTRLDGYNATKALMSGNMGPTAILALSDVLAYGAVDALQELGVDVPGQVSVTGFDDLAESAWFRPRLTTVRQPIVTKGRMAADFLISAIRGEDQHPHQMLGTSLIVRDSTTKPA
jgi:DNA-binding LacI/PurR family transcriptional regulator